MSNLSLIQAARKLVREYNVRGELLHQAVPYLNQFQGCTFVLKIGGSILNDMLADRANLIELCHDISFLKAVGINIIIIHGGGKLLDEALIKGHFKIEKIDGLRVSSPEIINVAKGVFRTISEAIETELKKCGPNVALLTAETKFVQSVQLNEKLQCVGLPTIVNLELLNTLPSDTIAVIPSITASADENYAWYNVNADDVARIIAEKTKAEKLILMTDVEGVLSHDNKLIHTLDREKTQFLIDTGVIHGGMLPKVNSCVMALNNGVKKAHIIKGNRRSVMDEVLTDTGIGTQFVQ